MNKMTALPWSTKCVKYLLFIFNLLFVITGIIILSVGATIHGIYGNYRDFLEDGYLSTSSFLVAIGTIIFFISFFGCCGAVKENFCMTITFSALLILIFIFEMSAGISGYILRDRTQGVITGTLKANLNNYNESRQAQKLWDVLQQSFECCGVDNYTDWEQKFSGVPVSCCGPSYGMINITSCNSSSETFYHEPCIKAFGDIMKDHAATLGGVAIGLAFVQLIGIIFSCHLAKRIRASYTSV